MEIEIGSHIKLFTQPAHTDRENALLHCIGREVTSPNTPDQRLTMSDGTQWSLRLVNNISHLLTEINVSSSLFTRAKYRRFIRCLETVADIRLFLRFVFLHFTKFTEGSNESAFCITYCTYIVLGSIFGSPCSLRMKI